MNHDIDDEMRDFTTTYNKAYFPKRIKRCLQAKPFYPDYIQANPINDTFKDRLVLQKQNELMPPLKRTENPGDVLNRVRSEHPHLKKFLPTNPPDEAFIELRQKQLFQSIYQIDYSKNLDNRIKEKEAIEIVLPENYSLQETEQKKSYQNPRRLVIGQTLKPMRLIKPIHNIKVDLKEREILRVRTGFSEYQDTIGKTG